jgi:hypothetical protein
MATANNTKDLPVLTFLVDDASAKGLLSSSALGAVVRLLQPFEGYAPGGIAIVQEFVFHAFEGGFFRVQFITLPGSFEDVPVASFSSLFKVIGPATSELLYLAS